MLDFSVPSSLLTSSLHSGYRLCQVTSSSSKWNILFWCHYNSGAVTKRYTADDRVWESLLMFEMEYKKAGIIGIMGKVWYGTGQWDADQKRVIIPACPELYMYFQPPVFEMHMIVFLFLIICTYVSRGMLLCVFRSQTKAGRSCKAWSTGLFRAIEKKCHEVQSSPGLCAQSPPHPEHASLW